MAEKILVTGGAGYIGSHCVLELLQAGFVPVVIDNFHNAIRGTESPVPGRAVPRCRNPSLPSVPQAPRGSPRACGGCRRSRSGPCSSRSSTSRTGRRCRSSSGR